MRAVRGAKGSRRQGTGVYSGGQVYEQVGTGVYVWELATESEVADTRGSTATVRATCESRSLNLYLPKADSLFEPLVQPRILTPKQRRTHQIIMEQSRYFL